MSNTIVVGFDKSHVFAAGTFVVNLMRYCGEVVDEVTLISDALSAEQKSVFRKVSPCNFVTYRSPVCYDIRHPPFVIERFTDLVFSKFECLRLLERHDSVVWLDYDQLLLDSIPELFQPSNGGMKVLPGGARVRDQLLSNVDDFDMFAEGMCGSTIVFQKSIGDFMQMYDFCATGAQRYLEKLHLGEQAIFDFMIQNFRIDAERLDPKIYTPHPTNPLTGNEKILHSYGYPKFWNGLSNDQWTEYYRAWLEAGGEAAPAHILSQ